MRQPSGALGAARGKSGECDLRKRVVRRRHLRLVPRCFARSHFPAIQLQGRCVVQSSLGARWLRWVDRRRMNDNLNQVVSNFTRGNVVATPFGVGAV